MVKFQIKTTSSAELSAEYTHIIINPKCPIQPLYKHPHCPSLVMDAYLIKNNVL